MVTDAVSYLYDVTRLVTVAATPTIVVDGRWTVWYVVLYTVEYRVDTDQIMVLMTVTTLNGAIRSIGRHPPA